MNEQYPSFEITLGEREVSLQIGRCAVALFRQQQEVSYVAVDLEDDHTLRIFNNQEFAEWLAGYRVVNQDGEIQRPTTRAEFNGIQQTFREVTGWSPAVVEREQPNETEMEMFLDINMDNVDEELKGLLGD